MILDKHTKYFCHYIASFNHSILLCEMFHILRLLVGFWKKVVVGETCMNSVWCSAANCSLLNTVIASTVIPGCADQAALRNDKLCI